ncbi:MAG: response regulator transcription factor [Acidobacteria bacterium]|jgi:two-component system alkaline phosphatase synthesis response regulator PhoP|nr:response regulator transcription factor [Acidobacteriota bacterium]
MKKHILIVDDEEHLADALAHNLQFEGFSTTIAYDGEEGLRLARTIQFDLVILDIMMPELDGLEVCKRLRATGSRVPILFLTAKAADADRLLGLKVGADDYVAKPFLLEELILRIHGIFRRQEWYRSAPEEREAFRFGDNEVNFLTYEAKTGDRKVDLTEKECMLMKLLVERRNQVVSREEILERVWGYRFSTSSRTIDNFIVRLRRYFESDPKDPQFIHSVRGVGYRFSCPD